MAENHSPVAAGMSAGKRPPVNQIDIVRNVSRKLQGVGIGYMLTGSMVMNYYALPRMTRDIDVVVEISSRDVERVTGLFRPDYYVSEDNIRESVMRESIFNVIHRESVIKVDCIVRKNDRYRRLEFERRRKVSVLDFTTYIVSKEDLIISKLWWARDSRAEIQLSDVKNLLATGFDAGYLEHWTRELRVNNLLQECLND
jgi:hypothetical protein